VLIWLRGVIASALIFFVSVSASLVGVIAVTSEAKAADYRHITSVSPSSGPTTGGTTVTISFQNFGDPAPCTGLVARFNQFERI
jgi:hypothetical protein